VIIRYELLIVEVKSTGVPVKENHVEGLCQLSLERAAEVEAGAETQGGDPGAVAPGKEKKNLFK
jgi:hypothetical protein